MCTSFNGCWEKCTMMERQRSISARKSRILSRNASGILGFHTARGGIESMSHQHPQSDYNTWNCTNYYWLKDMMQGCHEEALAVARDTHQQALAAAALLGRQDREVKSSLSCGCLCSGNHRCLGSHWYRSQTGSHQTKVPQVASYQGELTRRWAMSLQPWWLRQQVTFMDDPRKDTRAEEPIH